MEAISKHRGELMGVATVAVLIHHVYTGLHVSLVPVIPELGFAGVDIFLFLSGFGLCWGYGRYKSVWKFYRRRFARIYPTYLAVIIIGGIFVFSYSILDMLILSTGIGYFLPDGASFDWYIPALFLCYLCFPVIYYLINKDIRWGWVILLCSFVPMPLKYAGICSSYAALALPRLPIFVTGVIAGVLNNKSRGCDVPALSSASRRILEITAVIGCIVYVWLMNSYTYRFLEDTMLKWYPLILIVPGFCLLFSRMLDKMPRGVSVVLGFIGGISLEIYLFQVVMLLPCGSFVAGCDMLSSPLMQWLSGVVFILLSVLAGYLLSMFMKFMSWCYRRLSDRQ